MASRIAVAGETPSSPSRNPWRMRDSGLITITGITTQTTAYAVSDDVGTGQSIPNLGTVNNPGILIHEWFSYYNLAPTTTEAGLGIAFHQAARAAGVDNTKDAVTAADAETFVGQLANQLTGYGGIQNVTGISVSSQSVGVAGKFIPTAADGSLWIQCFANTAFTIASLGTVKIRFFYRLANFVGIN